MAFKIKQDDLEPPLVVVIEDPDGIADFNDVVSWRAIGNLNDSLKIDEVPEIAVDGTNHSKVTVTYRWRLGDTDTVGDMSMEFEALWPGTPPRPQTFPPDDYETVSILPQLG